MMDRRDPNRIRHEMFENGDGAGSAIACGHAGHQTYVMHRLPARGGIGGEMGESRFG
jgi:hypothetical protein